MSTARERNRAQNARVPDDILLLARRLHAVRTMAEPGTPPPGMVLELERAVRKATHAHGGLYEPEFRRAVDADLLRCESFILSMREELARPRDSIGVTIGYLVHPAADLAQATQALSYRLVERFWPPMSPKGSAG